MTKKKSAAEPLIKSSSRRRGSSKILNPLDSRLRGNDKTVFDQSFSKASASGSLLVELLTEELPPKSLKKLSEAFCDKLVEGLQQDNLLTEKSAAKTFATPRRLAVFISDVLDRAPDQAIEILGPSVRIGLGADGEPTQALVGFAKKNGVTVDELVQTDTPKGKVFACRKVAAGTRLEANLEHKVEEALKRLPAPKMMRWGSGEAEFVRPVHGLVMMHGSHVVRGEIWGLKSTNQTVGHRFLSAKPIRLKHADDYENALREKGKVEASFAARRSRIKKELERAEKELAEQIACNPNGRIPIPVQRIVIDTERIEPHGRMFPQALELEAIERALDCGGGTALLDEVTALVEWPRAYWGHFDEQFLEIPVECLALTMKHNQKYFPVFDAAAKLLPYFVVIGNNDDSLVTEQAKQTHQNIVSGNERVLRPRLADARFFYDQDRRARLEERVPHLAQVVYHNKLGSQRDRIDRIKLLAGKIARDLDADSALAERAAELSKADLLTAMVGEFPELQGIMGRYYARHDRESETVANAIEAHYRPRFAGDRLPQGLVACAVALADKLDILVGIFGIGQTPTGDKDPFSLRRHALGIVRILMETPLAADLSVLLTWAQEGFSGNSSIDHNVVNIVHAFIIERLRNYESLQNAFEMEEIEAVASQNPTRLDTVINRLSALQAFRMLPEAPNLAAANKRIKNILRQANYRNVAPQPDLALAKEPAEILLINAVQKLGIQIDAQLSKSHEVDSYVVALKALATVREPVDKFFDDIMVMVEDIRLRENRLAILSRISNLMNRVADISKLAG